VSLSGCDPGTLNSVLGTKVGQDFSILLLLQIIICKALTEGNHRVGRYVICTLNIIFQNPVALRYNL
jgi:hypothetical protein